MNPKPLVLVSDRDDPEKDPDLAECLTPRRELLALLKPADLPLLTQDSADLVAGAERLMVLPSPALTPEALHFLSGWGIARPGALLWLNQPPPLPGLTPCPDSQTLATELLAWEAERESTDSAEKLKALGYWQAPAYFLKAVSAGDETATALFIKAGLSPDLADDKGVPALCLAARAGHTGVCRILLEAGCDRNAVASDRNNNALMDAAAEGNEELARLLVNAGTELDRQSKNDQTALMLAVGINNPAIVSLLLEAGANTTLTDVLGMTAFQYGKILGFGTIVALFEKKGVTGSNG